MATPNALFAVISVANPAAMDLKLQQAHPWVFLKVAEGQWLLVAPAATTSKEVSDRLGITNSEPASSNAIVLRVENYFGRNPVSVWEWITAKRGLEIGDAATV